MVFKSFLCSLVIIVCTQSAHLPDYIKACSKSDPNFKECVKNSANAAITVIANGDKKYGVSNIKPLVVPKLTINTNNLNLTFTDFEIWGLENMKVVNTDVDLVKNKGVFDVKIDQLVYKGHYRIDGRILVLPIQGEGDSKIKFDNLEIKYFWDYAYSEKSGVKYGKLVNDKVTYKVKKVEFYFGNLFNDDKRLGPEMNKVLNENWEAVNKDLEGAISKPMSEICTSIANNYYNRVPFREIFLD